MIIIIIIIIIDIIIIIIIDIVAETNHCHSSVSVISDIISDICFDHFCRQSFDNIITRQATTTDTPFR